MSPTSYRTAPPRNGILDCRAATGAGQALVRASRTGRSRLPRQAIRPVLPYLTFASTRSSISTSEPTTAVSAHMPVPTPNSLRSIVRLAWNEATSVTPPSMSRIPSGIAFTPSSRIGSSTSRVTSLIVRFPVAMSSSPACRTEVLSKVMSVQLSTPNQSSVRRWLSRRSLPVLTETSYEGLAIAEGAAAGLGFVEMAYRGVSEERAREIRANLLEYCALDTMAMVEIVRFFTA